MLPDWKLRALADPDLNERSWALLKLGPRTLAEAWMLQALKIKYQIRGIRS